MFSSLQVASTLCGWFDWKVVGYICGFMQSLVYICLLPKLFAFVDEFGMAWITLLIGQGYVIYYLNLIYVVFFDLLLDNIIYFSGHFIKVIF